MRCRRDKSKVEIISARGKRHCEIIIKPVEIERSLTCGYVESGNPGLGERAPCIQNSDIIIHSVEIVGHNQRNLHQYAFGVVSGGHYVKRALVHPVSVGRCD